MLAETLGSIGAGLHAGPGRIAVGLDINATHHRAARSGLVTGTATLLSAGARSSATTSSSRTTRAAHVHVADHLPAARGRARRLSGDRGPRLAGDLWRLVPPPDAQVAAPRHHLVDRDRVGRGSPASLRCSVADEVTRRTVSARSRGGRRSGWRRGPARARGSRRARHPAGRHTATRTRGAHGRRRDGGTPGRRRACRSTRRASRRAGSGSSREHDVARGSVVDEREERRDILALQGISQGAVERESLRGLRGRAALDAVGDPQLDEGRVQALIDPLHRRHRPTHDPSFLPRGHPPETTAIPSPGGRGPTAATGRHDPGRDAPSVGP